MKIAITRDDASAEDGAPGRAGRRATIVAMDAVGYSRAMSADEQRALVALAASRNIIDPTIAAGGGRIFATAGDSVLAEFGSCEAAVRCGIEIQAALENERRGGTEVLTFRIGIHTGRVFPVGQDLLGDVVNTAARIESLANPYGMCVSEHVVSALPTNPSMLIEPMGLQVLKGIKEPIGISRIRLGEPSRIASGSGKIRVAVMPFRSGEDDAHWAEGLADELTAALSRFSTLSIHARLGPRESASREFRRIASDLGVDFIVDGVLRVRVPRYRLTIQLIEGASGAVIWSDRIGDLSTDLLDLQDRLVDLVVGTLPGRLSRASAETSLAKGTDSLGARDHYYRGLHHADHLDAESSRKALACFEQAVAMDHDYAPALAMSALVRLRLWALDGSRGSLDPVAAIAEHALRLDPADGWSHLILGQITMYRRQLDAAEVHHKKAYALNPADSRILALRSPLAAYLGKPEEGREWIERAIAINPYHPPWYLTNLGLSCYCAGQYEEGASAYLGVSQPQTGVLAGLAACRAQMGDHEGARAVAEKVLRIQPDFSSEAFLSMRPFKSALDRNHLLDGLRRGGLPA